MPTGSRALKAPTQARGSGTHPHCGAPETLRRAAGRPGARGQFSLAGFSLSIQRPQAPASRKTRVANSESFSVVPVCFLRVLCLLPLAVAAVLPGRAQDVRFAQPYATAPLLNPALAGTTALRAVSIATRNQQPESGRGFLTNALCAEARLPRLRGVVGLLISYDRAGDAPLNRTQAQLLYGYQARLTDRWTASGAVTAGVGFQNGNLDRYIFGDQLLADGTTVPTAEARLYLPVTYPTIGTGLVFYEKQGWFGLAAHHANAPRLGTDNTARLPRRLVLHGGYKFFLLSTLSLNRFYEFSLTPLVNLQWQGPARGVDAGFSATYSPVVFGVLYRNPLLLSGTRDQRWLVGQLGLRRPGFSVGYSYELGLGARTAGFAAHELTLRLDVADYSGLRQKRNAPKQAPFLASPGF